MSNWKKGDRAVCINDQWNLEKSINDGLIPKEGVVYLVDDVRLDCEGDVGLRFADCVSYAKRARFVFWIQRGDERYWSATQFRKVIAASERTTVEQEASA